MYFGDLTDRAGCDVFVDEPRIVRGMTLIAHLRDDLRLRGALCEASTFFHGPRERLLQIHVFAERHRCKGDHGMGVVGRADDDGVDVVLLLEHLAEIRVAVRLLRFRLEPLQVLDLRLQAARLLGARRFLDAIRHFPNLLGDLPIARRDIAPIHVTQRNEILRAERGQVRSPDAAHADTGDVHQIARRRMTRPAEHVPRNDHERGSPECGALYEAAARGAYRLVDRMPAGCLSIILHVHPSLRS